MRNAALTAAVLAATLALPGCVGADRVLANLQQQGCRVRAYTENPCPVAPPLPQEPRYCYRTLAGVECYATEVQYNIDDGWRRSPPPDLTR